MPSTLGKLIRSTRTRQGLSLRELARRIDRSPSFLVALELEETPPAVGEETLIFIARELALDEDQLITLAGRTPEDVAPENATEVAIYRIVKHLSDQQKQELLAALQLKYRKTAP